MDLHGANVHQICVINHGIAMLVIIVEVLWGPLSTVQKNPLNTFALNFQMRLEKVVGIIKCK